MPMRFRRGWDFDPGNKQLDLNSLTQDEQVMAVLRQAILDAGGGSSALEITFDPTATSFVSTDVQGALEETSTELDSIPAQINAAVAALVDGAPGALDTLNELAAALNDDAAFSATVTAALATKLDAEQVMDLLGNGALVAGANITLTYNDVAGTLTIASSGGSGGSSGPAALSWGAFTTGDIAAGDVTPTLPAYDPGDVLVFMAFRNDSGAVGTPTGWNVLHGTSGVDRNFARWKVASAGEVAPTFTVGAYCTWIMGVVKGGGMVLPIDFGWSDAGGQQVAIPNTQGASLIGVFGGQYSAQGPVPAAPSGWTRRAALAGSAHVGFYTDDSIGAQPIAALGGFPAWSLTIGFRDLQPLGVGHSDPRKLFRDNCAAPAVPSLVTVSGGVGFDTYDVCRTLTGVASYTTPPFVLRGTPVVELDVTQRSGYTGGDLRLKIKKQSTGGLVAQIAMAGDSNIVAFNSANAPMGNINTGGTSAGFTDGTSVRVALSVDKSGLCTATATAITGGSGTSNANSQQAWGMQTLKWASGLAGLVAGDQLVVELVQDQPGGTSRVVAMNRLTVTNGARGM